jgi:predicted nucleic acid-binding protein
VAHWSAPPVPKDRADTVRRFFRRSFLRVRNVTRRTSELAQDLVWDHQIRPKDAIHVATAIEARVAILETFDEPLIGKSGSIAELPIIIRMPIGPDQRSLPL